MATSRSLLHRSFCCGAKPEYEFIRDTFGFAKEVPQYLGLCRFDNLIRAGKRDKVILVMPTWRGSYYPSGDAFLKTAFFEKFQSFLSSSRVKEMLETYDYQLIFYPHVEMQKYNKHFHTDSDRITIADKSTHDVQQLLMSCSLLITDYSSVFLMWHFSKNRFCFTSLMRRNLESITTRRDILITGEMDLVRSAQRKTKFLRRRERVLSEEWSFRMIIGREFAPFSR